MYGVVLCGGTGSRLGNLVKSTNKHLLPVGRYPMVVHSIHKLVSCGIKDIMVIIGPEHSGQFMDILRSGKDYGCDLTFRIQESSLGIADALKLCKGFVGSDSFIVILGDNVFEDKLDKHIAGFNESKYECRLFLKNVESTSEFAEAIVNDLGEVTCLVEKPLFPITNLCVTGIYMYKSTVFNIIDKLKISQRNEYEITDVNNCYIQSRLCDYRYLDGFWLDAGTIESYYSTNKYIMEHCDGKLL